MLAPPRKRPRSPSPPPDAISSPLDILLKRRRQYSYGFHEEAQDYIAYNPTFHSAYYDQAGPSNPEPSWSRFVEKRRTRQWEKLNNPTSSQTSIPQQHSQSRPNNEGSSPIRPQWLPQPETIRQPMSSSPVRNDAPTSSPFRISESQSSTRVGDGMDEEEMRREWGEEYYSQNALLHRLHLARANHRNEQVLNPEGDTAMERPSATDLASPHFAQSTHMQTPYQTPYRTSYFAPSSPFNQPPSSMNGTPYFPTHHSNSFTSSSPFFSHAGTHHTYPQNLYQTPGRQDNTMEVLTSPEGPIDEAEMDVRNRYEETNRLLAELAVVRSQKWGDDMAP